MSGGYRKYLEAVVPLLHRSSLVSSVELFAPSGMALPSELMAAVTWPPKDFLSGFRILKAELRDRKPDVVFIPSARFVDSGLPTAIMVRNMEPLIAPFRGNSLMDAARNVGRSLTAKYACRRATRVIAVSPFVRDFLNTRWQVPPGKISVIPHGVEPPLLPADQHKPEALRKAAVAQFIFAAGSIRPMRGLEDILNAFEMIAGSLPRLSLVIAGRVAGAAESYHDRLLATVRAAGLEGRVVWAGELGKDEMAWCYANCSAFIMSSRIEACPNTALEAMAYGARIVSTQNRPMPETFGRAAAYYDAGDSSTLARQISTILGATPSEQKSASMRAAERASEFSWQQTADQTARELMATANCR